MPADSLTLAIKTAVAPMSGVDFSDLVGVARRTGDRWLAMIRDDDISCLPPVHLAKLIRYEKHRLGSSAILEAMVNEELIDKPLTDSMSIAKCITTIATSQRSSSMLIGQMAEDIADGHLSDDEARRLLPLLDEVISIAQDKCRSLTDLSRTIHHRMANRH